MESIQATTADEIILVDHFEDDEDEIREVHVKFVQDRRFKGIRRDFTIFNKNQLLQSLQSFKNKRGNTHRINLKFVRQAPERHRQFAWRSLQISGLGFVLSAIPACVWYFTEFKSIYLLVASLLFFVAGVVALLLFFYRSRDTYVYRSIAAGVPLIELDFNKPNRQEFEAFTDRLEAYIRKAQSSGLNNQQRLAGELKDIRRLKEAGLLSEEIYANSRALIFKHKEFSVG
jgi:hypothetical protein